MVIISRDVSQRLKEKSKLQKQQKSQMDLSNIDKTNNNYRSFQSSKDDDYMKSALQKVRNNKSTIDTNYARFTGTSLYNDSTFHYPVNNGLKIVKSDDLDKPLDKEYKKLHTIQPTKKTITPTKKKKKFKNLNPKSDTKIEDYSWNKICEQLDKPRLFKYMTTCGILRESLEKRLIKMNRKNLYE
jgi:hypothetical protein